MCVKSLPNISLQYFQKNQKFDISVIFQNVSGNPEGNTPNVDRGEISGDYSIRKLQPPEYFIEN